MLSLELSKVNEYLIMNIMLYVEEQNTAAFMLFVNWISSYFE